MVPFEKNEHRPVCLRVAFIGDAFTEMPFFTAFIFDDCLGLVVHVYVFIKLLIQVCFFSISTKPLNALPDLSDNQVSYKIAKMSLLVCFSVSQIGIEHDSGKHWKLELKVGSPICQHFIEHGIPGPKVWNAFLFFRQGF
ncbi:unnamed protein product [Protopolystoma xenopodis]|uniref:Uncharacterized protein n=1 Tax=Protopolystoma xenopodis TaxID=117903 RepID=A0A3S5BQD6_9PLAT|nr:unnamed protein product [Protopolystoma xenopodis]